jgi:hypothetical protein
MSMRVYLCIFLFFRVFCCVEIPCVEHGCERLSGLLIHRSFARMSTRPTSTCNPSTCRRTAWATKALHVLVLVTFSNPYTARCTDPIPLTMSQQMVPHTVLVMHIVLISCTTHLIRLINACTPRNGPRTNFELSPPTGLAEALQVNVALTYLNVSQNRITDEGATSFHQHIKVHPSNDGGLVIDTLPPSVMFCQFAEPPQQQQTSTVTNFKNNNIATAA